jgi:hypothetical protein
MKKIILLVFLAALCFCGCYQSVRETLTCPRLSLPDSLRVQGLGRYYNKTMDVEWLDAAIPRDSVESYLRKAIPDHLSRAGSDNARAKLIEETLQKAIQQWHYYQNNLSGNYIVVNYQKYWFQIGSAVGVAIIKDCTIVGDIHFPEVKSMTGEIVK